ncbi:Ceramide glucosyltransferase [Neocucurbitaria cava]|uniref:Ceramide glucosyltransferase n=1 Tax=Neocucurbitaria cava TaxID=798079 RepID=A0A9W8YJ19_9PLEO|nr:Ceramide glucosyltransferase [Neocucurbitaria cava]
MVGAPSQDIRTNDVSMLRTVIATGCLIWFVVVWCVCLIGFTQLFRYYWRKPLPATCVTTLEEEDVPRVTVVRPVKGLEPRLYECLAASLRQTYPKDKINTVFCVSERSDPAFPILERLCRDFKDVDVQILVEEEDPLLLNDKNALGPNPKIRNMSRAYREAKGDVVWILDCNVWVGKGVCGRLVDLLCGFGRGKNGTSRTKFKFVHQTPASLFKTGRTYSGGRPTENGQTTNIAASTSSDPRNHSKSTVRRLLQRGGGRLDEAFLSSSHAKFYLAINTVAIAPCIIGKSTMFRRSQLNYITSSNPNRTPGIDFFSDNICEDHLIGDALKFTVTLATFVEPGTESILCGLYGAYALTTLPSFVRLGISPTWSSFLLIWLINMSLWCTVDYIQYLLLHSAKTVEIDPDTPDFILPQRSASAYHRTEASQPLLGGDKTPGEPSLLDGARRNFKEFFFAWLGREMSALPIWIVAFWGGVTVEWRGRKFWVGLDMKVHEIANEEEEKAGK